MSGTSFIGEERPAADGEMGVLKVSAVSEGHFRPEENKALPTSFAGNEVGVNPMNGDIIMSRSNGSIRLVGACAYVTDDFPALVLPDTLWKVVVADPKETNPKWLWYALSSQQFRTELKSVAIGTVGMKKISKGSLLSLEVFKPPRELQDAIARILDLWTRAESTLSKLITAKVRFKQGLMQQLLTGQRRLPGYIDEWNHVRIGDVAHEVSERNHAGDSIPVLSCTKYDGLVDSLEYFGKRVFSENTDNYKVVRRSEFAYATNHIEEGSIGLLRHAEAGLVSPMYTVFCTNGQVNPDYLYRVLKTETFRQVFASFTSASVNRRGSLRWKQFATISLELPSIQEQRRINDVMALLDLEIDLLRKELEALKKQKKGLMQKLLTGEIRVKIPHQSERNG